MSSVIWPLEVKTLLQEFRRRDVRFILVGLTAAVLQGAEVATHDVDLWVEDLGSEQFQEAIKAARGFYIPPNLSAMTPPIIGPEPFRMIDLVVFLHGLDNFESEYQNTLSLTVDQVELNVLRLDRIILSKKATNRPKDRATLPILETVWKISTTVVNSP